MNKLAIAKEVRPGKSYVVELTVTCPICATKWKFEYVEHLENMRGITGAVGEAAADSAGKFIKVDSSRWGTQALCGECMAMKLTVITDNQYERGVLPWTDQDTKDMHGRLIHQQGRYHAVARIKRLAGDVEQLVDEQKERRGQIIGNNNTAISREKLKQLGLEKWEWRMIGGKSGS